MENKDLWEGSQPIRNLVRPYIVFVQMFRPGEGCYDFRRVGPPQRTTQRS